MDFYILNNHTEELITWLLPRLTEDETLARAMRRPRLHLPVLGIDTIRGNIGEYRRAVHKVVASEGLVRWFWVWAARSSAWTLRLAARHYVERSGFDRGWLKAPR